MTVEKIIENEGNVDYGTVYHIKQIHNLSPDIREQRGIRDLTPGEKREVAIYQGNILNYLLEKDITDVFNEANIGELPAGIFYGVGELFRAVFSEGAPEEPTEEQIEFLYNMGGANIYSALRDNVTIHQTETIEGNRSENKDARERITIAYLQEFFKENKGSEVVLVYGGGHYFSQYVDEGFNPRIEAVSFDFNWDLFRSSGQGKTGWKRILTMDFLKDLLGTK